MHAFVPELMLCSVTSSPGWSCFFWGPRPPRCVWWGSAPSWPSVFRWPRTSCTARQQGDTAHTFSRPPPFSSIADESHHAAAAVSCVPPSPAEPRTSSNTSFTTSSRSRSPRTTTEGSGGDPHPVFSALVFTASLYGGLTVLDLCHYWCRRGRYLLTSGRGRYFLAQPAVATSYLRPAVNALHERPDAPTASPND